MPQLPRGTCPVCGSEVSLRKGRRVREHRPGPSRVKALALLGMKPPSTCSGSGRRAEPEVPGVVSRALPDKRARRDQLVASIEEQ